MKIYHHNDMDGFCAGTIVMAYIFKEYDSYCVNYENDVGDKFDKAEKGEEVWIVDYSFTEDTKYILENLMKKHCKIIWIDHHDSSIELEKNHPEFKILRGIRNKAYSGAALTYMFIRDCEYKYCPKFIKYISDYDTFQRVDLPDSDYFKLGYDAEENKMRILEELLKIDYDEELTRSLISKGKVIKKYIDSDYKSYCNKYGFETVIDGIKTFVINRKCNSWIFGEKYDEYPMVCSYAYDGIEYNYSLYSKDGKADCSKIAEKFGGGGHKGAAGFRSKELIFNK